jgi:transcriptional regulator with XRE-family HTH domain
LRRLSELAGISNPYLSQIERGLRRPSAEILQQLAKALRISAETLYVQAGILEPGNGETDLARQILADPHLSEDQKQALVRIYLSFRHENESGRHEDESGRHEDESGRHEDESGAEPRAGAPAEPPVPSSGTPPARAPGKAAEVASR